MVDCYIRLSAMCTDWGAFPDMSDKELTSGKGEVRSGETVPSEAGQ